MLKKKKRRAAKLPDEIKYYNIKKIFHKKKIKQKSKAKHNRCELFEKFVVILKKSKTSKAFNFYKVDSFSRN